MAETVERAFVDREGYRKSLCRGIVLRVGGAYAGVGVTLTAIVEPNLLPILSDTIGIVDVAAGQKAQD